MTWALLLLVLGVGAYVVHAVRERRRDSYYRDLCQGGFLPPDLFRRFKEPR